MSESRVTLTSEAFDHGSRRDGGDFPGNRGVLLSAETGFTSGIVFSTRFPDVWITESGTVEVGDFGVPVDTFREWVVQVLAAMPEQDAGQRGEVHTVGWCS